MQSVDNHVLKAVGHKEEQCLSLENSVRLYFIGNVRTCYSQSLYGNELY